MSFWIANCRREVDSGVCNNAQCNGKKSHDQIFVIELRSESFMMLDAKFLRNSILEKGNGKVAAKMRCENVNWQEGCSQTSSLIAATFLPDPAQDITTVCTPRSQVCGVLSSDLSGLFLVSQ